MKRGFLCVLVIICFFSCAGYRVTKFTPDKIRLGDAKELVLKKYGKPYMMSFSKDGNKVIETFSYKEIVDVDSYSFSVTTTFIFEDAILIKMEQKDDRIDNVVQISKDC